MLEDKYCTFPLRPNLSHIMAIEDDERVLFTSDEKEDGEEYEEEVNDLYEKDPKADA